jgi:hypothetical protein
MVTGTRLHIAFIRTGPVLCTYQLEIGITLNGWCVYSELRSELLCHLEELRTSKQAVGLSPASHCRGSSLIWWPVHARIMADEMGMRQVLL